MFTCTAMSLYHDVIWQSVNLPVLQGRPHAESACACTVLKLQCPAWSDCRNTIFCCRRAANCGFADFMKNWQGQRRDAGSL